MGTVEDRRVEETYVVREKGGKREERG